MQDSAPRLRQLIVADEGRAWEAAGFQVIRYSDPSGSVLIGEVTIRLVGSSPPTTTAEPHVGITGWSFDNLGPDFNSRSNLIDGIETYNLGDTSTLAASEVNHPNGVVHLDHVVMTTSGFDRSIDELQQAGFQLRRIREAPPNRQAFFWAGGTIIELVGPAQSAQAASEIRAAQASQAQLWGLAMTCRDLAETAKILGNKLGPIKQAVQPGRQIATLRGKQLGLSVPIVLMTPHRSVSAR